MIMGPAAATPGQSGRNGHTRARHAARTGVPRLDLLDSEGRHLVENAGGEVDQGLGAEAT
jgi:hypothetical protein